MVRQLGNIEDMKAVNESIAFFTNRRKYYENKVKAFQTYNLPLLVEKAAHEVGLATASIKKLERRRTKLYQLLN